MARRRSGSIAVSRIASARKRNSWLVSPARALRRAAFPALPRLRSSRSASRVQLRCCSRFLVPSVLILGTLPMRRGLLCVLGMSKCRHQKLNFDNSSKGRSNTSFHYSSDPIAGLKSTGRHFGLMWLNNHVRRTADRTSSDLSLPRQPSPCRKVWGNIS